MPFSKTIIREGRLSRDLKKILEKAEGQPLTVGQLRQILKGRGFALLIILFALPFTVPISIPGLSTPFGLAIAFLGFRMALGKRPWLPQRVQRAYISYATLEKIVSRAIRVATFLEKMVKPRLRWMRYLGLARIIGIVIAFNGLMLCLPLPVPFTNTIPALAIILLTLGRVERDGIFTLAGFFVTLLGIGYIIFWVNLGKLGWEELVKYWPF
ncbi:MAG: exopolysaccharide biosynthesis protein [Verrucomicrobiae bacterium]|nr:exopolysaccharide biosynthesis protein [Verrucomicrobiae bacterium]